MAIILAALVFSGVSLPKLVTNPGAEAGIVVLLIIAGILVYLPMKKARKAKEA